MSDFYLKKRGWLLGLLLFTLAWLGGKAYLDAYPPTMSIVAAAGEGFRLPEYGDGKNWIELAQELERVGIITMREIEQQSLTSTRVQYFLELSENGKKELVTLVTAVMALLKKSFIGVAKEKIGKMFKR